ncbi:FecR domain-containing protein [uncultured Sunxiuqinia sp.]|uniref:FecR family protein n=1 Tax=uncultured Sunxiuqinia sp. TaxID=1573825 RepID=UPI002AA7D4BD|nr:FecR domain-containing protein [uncultured Sunxiuqinia sp.]
MRKKNSLLTNQKYERSVQEHAKLSDEDKLIQAHLLYLQKDEIDTDRAYSFVKKQIRKGRRVFRLYQQFNRVAAILILPLLLLSAWALVRIFDQPADFTEQPFVQSVQEVLCPVGTRSKVILPDGSKVWLNAGTTLKYNLPFSSTNRNIELHGEAFLDVAKMENSEFKIYSNNVEVVVHGTQFNFRSYHLDDRVEVCLVEGSIDLNIHGEDKSLKQAKLKPGDHLSYNKEKKSTELISQDLNKFIAWRKGLLVFDDAPLVEVARELERWYGVDVEIADESLLSFRYTTTFEDESIQQVVDLLELSSSMKVEYLPKSEVDLAKSKVIFKRK